MAYNNNNQAPFWDWVRAFDNQGAGVDHPAQNYNMFGGPAPGAEGFRSHPPPHFGPGFPFGGPGFFSPRGFGPGPHRGGRRGRHCHRRDGSEEREDHEGHRSRSRSHSPHGERGEGEAPNREGSPHGSRGPHHRHGHGRHGPGGRGGWGGARGGWGGARGGWGGRGHRGHPSGMPDGSAFDFTGFIEGLAAHPLAQAFRTYAEQSGFGGQRSGETLVPEDADAENTFTPPIDIFSTEKEYVLHVALPGAKKEDVGVNWDAEKGVLNLAGVVYRRGDEDFLKTLSQSERKVGMFERTVKLPPGDEEKEEVDGDAITAKLEDGVLIVSVPKVEKEWTEVKRVDIE